MVTWVEQNESMGVGIWEGVCLGCHRVAERTRVSSLKGPVEKCQNGFPSKWGSKAQKKKTFTPSHPARQQRNSVLYLGVKGHYDPSKWDHLISEGHTKEKWALVNDPLKVSPGILSVCQGLWALNHWAAGPAGFWEGDGPSELCFSSRG